VLEGRKGMQEIIYQIYIENGIVLDDVFLEKLNKAIEDITECKVIRSRVGDEGTVVETGEWEDEEDE
jgi:hypothetical protein